MERTGALRTVTALSSAVLLGGVGMAFAYSSIEALMHPGFSLADGYGIGALPWTAIIEALVVGGATATVIAGAAAVAVHGGWARRIATFALAAVAALWWFEAWIGAGISGAPCAGCPPRTFDPWAYAYSAPMLALQMLIVPAAVIALLALHGPSLERRSYISSS